MIRTVGPGGGGAAAVRRHVQVRTAWPAVPGERDRPAARRACTAARDGVDRASIPGSPCGPCAPSDPAGPRAGGPGRAAQAGCARQSVRTRWTGRARPAGPAAPSAPACRGAPAGPGAPSWPLVAGRALRGPGARPGPCGPAGPWTSHRARVAGPQAPLLDARSALRRRRGTQARITVVATAEPPAATATPATHAATAAGEETKKKAAPRSRAVVGLPGMKCLPPFMQASRGPSALYPDADPPPV